MGLLFNILINLTVFAVVALGGGLGTAYYMMDSGSRLSTKTFGAWTTWTAAGRPDADPYTRAHTAWHTLLPLASTLELTYRARADSAGARLHAGCEYAVLIDGLDAAWWSIGVYDAGGRLIPNPADRYAYNSDTVMREPDGRAVITVARDARPGNWLPIGGSGRVVLVLTVQDSAWAAATVEGAPPKPLPVIQRVACR